MSKFKFLALLLPSLIFFECSTSPQNNVTQAEEGTSPFSSFEFSGSNVMVGVEGKKYTFLKMDSLEAKELVNLFEHNYESEWQKRFSEDFVEYSNKFGIYPMNQGTFTLKNAADEIVVLTLSSTERKRTAAKEFFEKKYKAEIDIKKTLSKQEASDDLNQLEQTVLDKYSYYFLNSVDVKNDIQKIREKIPDEISTFDFALLIDMFINKFGDGHSGVDNVTFKEQGKLPFETVPFDNEVVCLKEDKLLDEQYPFLQSINGFKIGELLKVTEKYLTPAASKQFRELTKVGRLNRIGFILEQLGNKDRNLTITLKNSNGDTKIRNESIVDDEKMTMRKRIARYNRNPFESKMIGDIGYLKIESMSSIRDPSDYNKAINTIKDAKKVIIDVRNNGGGRRAILMELAPNFIDSDQQSVIGNIARFRTASPSKAKSLKDRYLYQLDDDYFSEKDKSRIQLFKDSLQESMTVDDSLYTPEYYLYIKGEEEALFANVPTVVLMNSYCYSATDIFLSTFKEIDDVTLIGTKSGGGSGRTNEYRLDNSNIQLSLSSIVSYQPNGSLYDGIGVSPDILVEQESLSDLLGASDHQLEFAIGFLSKATE